MSKIVSKNQELNFIPSAYDSSNSTFVSYSTVNNGLNDINGTNEYARFTVATTQYYAYYNFSVTGIPENAENISVSCQVKATAASSSRITTKAVQLCYGTTPRGSSVTLGTTGTTADTVNISNAGTWTLSELSNIKLRLTGVRSTGSGGGNNSYYLYFWGARLTISYEISGTEYEITSTLSTDKIDSIDPAGLNYIFEGDNYELSIYGESIDDIKVEDNGVNVTSSLVQHELDSSGEKSTVLGEYTLVSGSFNGSGASYFQGLVGNDVNSTQTTTNYYSSGSGTIAVFTYNLIFSDIPSNATITRLYCQVNGHAESTSQNSEYMCAQLRSGNTELSEEINFKSIGTSNSTQTLEATTIPTLSQLEDLVLYCRLGYYGGAINGATCYIEYTLPSSADYYWTYTLTNVQADHTIIISDAIIEIPEEDPQYEYYPITISSINATTDPGRGTTRVVEGTNQTITIYPSDPQITLVTDNGVDITSQLVQHGGTIPDPTVSTASGASYGFTLNSNTGYYVSQNTGVSSSAAVCRVSFDLPVNCLVTIQYINYAEATYDFGVFGKIDTTLSTNAWNSSSSGGDSTTDAGLEQIRLNTNSSNSSTPQTLTYEIPSGEHYIDIKYGKDQASDDGNDNLQWKITNIEPLEANNYYTYTLSNIQEEHSLIFIFGDVTYYTITTSGNNCKLYPSGSMVVLPGEGYTVTAVPNNYSFNVAGVDNNVNITSSIQRVEQEVTKEGNTYTIVNYTYSLSNIQANHNIVINCTPSVVSYIKIDNRWVDINQVYKKESNSWAEEESIITALSDVTNLIFFS